MRQGLLLYRSGNTTSQTTSWSAQPTKARTSTRQLSSCTPATRSGGNARPSAGNRHRATRWQAHPDRTKQKASTGPAWSKAVCFSVTPARSAPGRPTETQGFSYSTSWPKTGLRPSPCWASTWASRLTGMGHRGHGQQGECGWTIPECRRGDGTWTTAHQSWLSAGFLS